MAICDAVCLWRCSLRNGTHAQARITARDGYNFETAVADSDTRRYRAAFLKRE